MGYPFNDNPLDEYLSKLFHLKIDEFNANCIRLDKTASKEERDAAGADIETLSEKIRELKNQFNIPERDLDQFKSPTELAVEKFLLENPEPPKPETYNCKHGQTQVVRRRFRNGSLHVVVQCIDCGCQPSALQKKEYNLDALPDFDEDLHKRLTFEWDVWESARYDVYAAEMKKGNDLPEFDEKGFNSNFQSEDPPPSFESCDHSHTEARLRTYKSGSTAVVLQCILCGHHTGSSSKSKYPNFSLLPSFDERLKERCKIEISAWCRRRGDAWRSAHLEHRKKVQQLIQAGEIASKDNSRFGTYYSSSEWERARARILQRDDHECQACNRPAECVHHIVYDRLGAENDLDLISLCNNCHNLIHQEQRNLQNILRMSPNQIRELHDYPDEYVEDDYDEDTDCSGCSLVI